MSLPRPARPAFRHCATCKRVSRNRLCRSCYSTQVKHIKNAYAMDTAFIQEEIKSMEEHKSDGPKFIARGLAIEAGVIPDEETMDRDELCQQVREAKRFYQQALEVYDECLERCKAELKELGEGLELDLRDLRERQVCGDDTESILFGIK